jgi:translation initiation factor IF-1
VTRTTE